MPTNIKMTNGQIAVQEGAEAVVTALQQKRDGLAKLTLLHGTHRSPVGPVWVNLANVEFVNEVS